MPRIIPILLLYALLMTACATAEPLSTTTPVASATFTEIASPPTSTLTPTSTPEPTAMPSPELPKIDLDINGDGVTDYVGSIKESQNIDIPEGEPARLDLIRIGDVSEYDTVATYTEYGYLTGYDIVSISNGSRDIDLVFLRVKYFRKDKPPVTAEFSFLKTIIDRYGFKGTDSLGKQINVEIATPAGSDFTERHRRKGKDVLNILDFEYSIYLPEGVKWLKAQEIVKLLKTSDTDLDFKFKVDPYAIQLR